jgi:hypothetical protein
VLPPLLAPPLPELPQPPMAMLRIPAMKICFGAIVATIDALLCTGNARGFCCLAAANAPGSGPKNDWL